MDEINVCEDEEFFKTEHLQDLKLEAQGVLRLINGYIVYLRKNAKRTDEAK